MGISKYSECNTSPLCCNDRGVKVKRDLPNFSKFLPNGAFVSGCLWFMGEG